MKKKRNRFLALWVTGAILATGGAASGQQIPVLSQYMFNGLVINAAATVRKLVRR